MHRKLIAQKYDGTSFRTLGRRRTAKEIASLVVRMAEENRAWGYRRIQGALANLGHILAHNTIANILKGHGIEPAPERSRKITWKEFLLERRLRGIVTSYSEVKDPFHPGPFQRLTMENADDAGAIRDDAVLVWRVRSLLKRDEGAARKAA